MKEVAERCEVLPNFPTRASLLVEVTQEIAKHKLGQIVGEAEANYNKYRTSKDDKAEEKAAYWFSQYQIAVEKLLRASGVYEKAKKDAERDQSRPNDIHFVVSFRNGVRPSPEGENGSD